MEGTGPTRQAQWIALNCLRAQKTSLAESTVLLKTVLLKTVFREIVERSREPPHTTLKTLGASLFLN